MGMGLSRATIYGEGMNHEHICEIRLLGRYSNMSEKEVKQECPNRYKMPSKWYMGVEDSCDNCPHFRRLDLNDMGNHITNIADKNNKELYEQILKETNKLAASLYNVVSKDGVINE